MKSNARTCRQRITPHKCSWDEHRTYAAVGLLLEHRVALRRLAQWHGVGREMLSSDFVACHSVQDHRYVAVSMLLRATQRQTLVHQRAERKLVDQSAEDSKQEYRAAFAAGHHSFSYGRWPVRLHPQLVLDLVVDIVRAGAVCLHADGFDADIGPPPAAQLTQGRQDFGCAVVQSLSADLLGDLAKPLRKAVDHHNPFGTQEHRCSCRHLTDTAGSPYRHNITRRDAAEISTRPSGWGRI